MSNPLGSVSHWVVSAGLAMLVVVPANAQCSGRAGGGGSAGNTGSISANSPTTTPLAFSRSSSNDLAYQRALGLQRQQMAAMYNQMQIQQRQLLAMRQALMQRNAEQEYAKQQDLIAARKERARAKSEERALRIAESKVRQAELASKMLDAKSRQQLISTRADLSSLALLESDQPSEPRN